MEDWIGFTQRLLRKGPNPCSFIPDSAHKDPVSCVGKLPSGRNKTAKKGYECGKASLVDGPAISRDSPNSWTLVAGIPSAFAFAGVYPGSTRNIHLFF